MWTRVIGNDNGGSDDDDDDHGEGDGDSDCDMVGYGGCDGAGDGNGDSGIYLKYAEARRRASTGTGHTIAHAASNYIQSLQPECARAAWGLGVCRYG